MPRWISEIISILGDAYKSIDKIREKIDTLILDPPRSGLTIEAKEKIININPPKIIYISCNPMTLARDLKDLQTEYELKKASVIDMFPYTHHCETVCILTRKTL